MIKRINNKQAIKVCDRCGIETPIRANKNYFYELLGREVHYCGSCRPRKEKPPKIHGDAMFLTGDRGKWIEPKPPCE